ncbi:MAG TPA: DinB family protein [Gemmatimonadaceae bacterium]|nr:DinB family protein [Gemmatimonadaceae bacterium]
MHPRINELLEYVADQRRQLRSTVEGIPSSRHNVAPTTGGWSILAVLEHLAIVEPRITAILRKRGAELRASDSPAESDAGPILKNIDVNRFLDRTRKIEAPTPIHPTGAMDLEAAWSALDRSRTEFIDTVVSLDGLALGTASHSHPIFGPVDLYTWIAFVGAHEARHADQIREIGSSFDEAP